MKARTPIRRRRTVQQRTPKDELMMSLALLGDSVLDNKAYTGREPDVAGHLRRLLSPEAKVTLCAVDGTTTSDLGSQIDRVPAHATHVVVSLGGNDALLNADLLDAPARSTRHALDLFRARLDAFEQAYGWALDAVTHLGRATTVCTIYNGALANGDADRARVALMMFNDVIFRAAVARAVDVLELRLVCTEPSDFANPIEPSGTGGLKIARAIAGAIGAGSAPHRTSRLMA
jgi:hypothetical protein